MYLDLMKYLSSILYHGSKSIPILVSVTQNEELSEDYALIEILKYISIKSINSLNDLKE